MDAEWVTDWAELAALRERWLRHRWPDGVPGPGRLAAHARDNFAAFSDFVAANHVGAVGPPPLAVAMVFFGPAGTPPPEIGEAAVAVHGQLEAAVADPAALNPFDLMLAFGCGWRRSVTASGAGWWGRWEVAYATMVNEARASLKATNHLLATQFPQFVLGGDDVLELAGDFAVSLVAACDCGHHQRGCRGACGRECCFPHHDLGSWDPGESHLRPFVDQAVRGTAGKQILGAAFAESLTYRALEREGRILRRRVEFKRCPRGHGLYEGARCPTPGCDPPAGVPICRVARANWLIHPEHEGGNYREVVRWVCGGCKCLYPIRFKRQDVLPAGPCPMGDWSPPPGKQPSRLTVWVRLFGDGGPGRFLDGDEIAPSGDPYEDAGEEADDDDG